MKKEKRVLLGYLGANLTPKPQTLYAPQTLKTLNPENSLTPNLKALNPLSLSRGLSSLKP